ncbi:equilibrative nucleoside transporter 1 isoform X1 [Leptinotarsa decemlineata]|uniref:equilibrative nucleoside transporter 1 isoform X1 n=3 Tax=Leptinotarsa decemlineata TaxID=7539 RepID=UPI003D3063AF
MHVDVNARSKNGNLKVELTDRFYVSYAVFYVMGILMNVPYHFYINAIGYWMFKFESSGPRHRSFPLRPTDFPHGSSHQISVTNKYVREQLWATSENYLLTLNETTPLQTNFASSFSIVARGSMLVSILVVTYFSNRFPPAEKRIIFALSVIFILFGISTVLTRVDTSGKTELFFAVSIIITTLMNFFSATAIISAFQLLKNFPTSYYPALHSGHSICGVIASLFQVILISTRMSSQSNGTYYFGFGTLIIFLSTLFMTMVNKKSRYFIYRVNTTRMIMDENWTANNVSNRIREKLVSGLLRTKWYYATFLFVQGSTAMIFPGFTALVVSENMHGTTWEKLYFRPVVSFLTFNAFNLIGREAAKIVKTPKHGIHVMIPALLRVALVPLIIFCNAHPRRHLPVFFGDEWYITFLAIFAFTEGIIVNISFLVISSVAKEEEVEMMLLLIPVAAFFTTTLCSGFNILITNFI